MRHLRKFFPIKTLELGIPNAFVLQEYVDALFVNCDDCERVFVIAKLQPTFGGKQLNRFPRRARRLRKRLC